MLVIDKIYTYCTDFIINLANILNLSYYEVNAMVFCLLYPLLIILLTAIYFLQRSRLRKIESQINDRKL